MCFLRHRPIKKVNKNKGIMVGAVLMNLVIISIYYTAWQPFRRDPTAEFEWLHWFLLYSSLLCLCISVPCFVISAVMDAGVIPKKYNFIRLVEQFLNRDQDLLQLCTYCEIIKSETSFHCQFCNQCIELFDHHCPFVDNCLGLRNYKYFLLFIFFYFCFLVFVTIDLVRLEIDLA